MQSNIIDFTLVRPFKVPPAPAVFPIARPAANGSTVYFHADIQDDESWRSVRVVIEVPPTPSNSTGEELPKYFERLCRSISSSAGLPVDKLLSMVATIEGTDERGRYLTIMWYLPVWFSDERVLTILECHKPAFHISILNASACAPTEADYLIGRSGLLVS